MNTQPLKINPVFQALLAAVLFSASAPFAKILLGEVDPIPLAALLYLGSGLGASLLLLIQSGRQIGPVARLTKSDAPWLIGAVMAGGVAAPILSMWGLKQTPASTASLLLNFECVATSLIAVFFFKEAMSKRVWGAIGLITLAAVLLSWNNSSWGISVGVLGILGACCLWGLDNNLTRQISANNPLLIVSIKGLGAGTFSLILAFLLGKSLPSIGVILLALLLGSISYGLSIQLYILALRGLGAARTGAYYGVAPFVGVLFSMLLLKEIPPLFFWVAIPFMLAGTYFLVTEDHHHLHTHPAMEHTHAHSHTDGHHYHEHPVPIPMINGIHTHAHVHEELVHNHPHTPDIHHRHVHDHS
jgi:drug/metabolite transporter (DMT)-like permease